MAGLMSDPHREIIGCQLRGLLAKELDTSVLFMSVMRENNCITEEIAEQVEINRMTSGRSGANEAFIKGLMTRPEKAFKQFVKALIETEQGHLADEIDEELKKMGEEPLSPGIRNPPSASATSVDSVDNTVSEIDEIVAYIENTENLSELRIQPMSDDHKNAILKSQICYQPRDSSGQRMRVIIINNEIVWNGNNSPGSEKDVENLRSLFRQFNCDVVEPPEKPIKTAQVMKDILERESGREDLKDIDVLIIVLMSRVKKNNIWGTDGKRVNILPDVTDYFSNEKCRQMIGKPKLFIIQACEDGDEHATLETSEFRTPDTYLAMPVVAGDISHRTRTAGSLFIRATVCAIAWHSHHRDFCSIMKMAKLAVSILEIKGHTTTHLPVEMSSLDKPCYLIHAVKDQCLTDHETETSRERVDEDFSTTGDNENNKCVSIESTQVSRKGTETKEDKILSIDNCRYLLRQTQNLPQDMNSQLRITGVFFTRDQIVIEFLEPNGHQQLTNEKLLDKFSDVLGLESSRIKLVKLSEYGSCSRTAMPGCRVCHQKPAVETSTTLSAYIVARETEDPNDEYYALSCGHDKEEGGRVLVNINTISHVQANVQNNDNSGNNSEQSGDTHSLNSSGSPYNQTADPIGPLYMDDKNCLGLGLVKHVICTDWNDYSVDCSLIKIESNIKSFLCGVKIGNRKVFISSSHEVTPHVVNTLVQTYTTNTKGGVVFGYPSNEFRINKHERPIREALRIRTKESTDDNPRAIHGDGESGLLVVTTIDTGTPGEGDAVYVEAVAMLIATREYPENGESKSYSIALPVSISLNDLEEYIQHKCKNRQTLTIWKPEENYNSEGNPM